MKIDNEEVIIELGRKLQPITIELVGNASRHIEGHGVTHDAVLEMANAIMKSRNELNEVCPVGDLVFINMLANCCIATAIASAAASGIGRDDSVSLVMSIFLTHIAKFHDEFNNEILKATEVQGNA